MREALPQGQRAVWDRKGEEEWSVTETELNVKVEEES